MAVPCRAVPHYIQSESGPLAGRLINKGEANMTLTTNYIAGEWIGGGAETRDINPSNTGDVVGQFAMAGEADTVRAIEAAKAAFPAWSRSGIQERHDILKRIGEGILARKD